MCVHKGTELSVGKQRINFPLYRVFIHPWCELILITNLSAMTLFNINREQYEDIDHWDKGDTIASHVKVNRKALKHNHVAL